MLNGSFADDQDSSVIAFAVCHQCHSLMDPYRYIFFSFVFVAHFIAAIDNTNCAIRLSRQPSAIRGHVYPSYCVGVSPQSDWRDGTVR